MNFWKKNKFLLQLLTLMLAVIIFIAMLGLLLTTTFAWFECKGYGWATERETKVTLGVCYVKTNAGWFAKSQLRGE